MPPIRHHNSTVDLPSPPEPHVTPNMGDDDYTVAGGKGLRLKGAKVKKNKKKKTEGSKAADKVTELDKALSADKRSDKDADAADGDDEQAPARQDEEYAPLRRKTETERRFEEAKRKKVRTKHTVRQPPAACPGWCAHLAFTPWSLCALMLTYRSAFETYSFSKWHSPRPPSQNC